MRYYEVTVPGRDTPIITTNARALRNLPEGTTCAAAITDRDGSLAESYEIPVVGGRVQVSGRGKQRPRLGHG